MPKLKLLLIVYLLIISISKAGAQLYRIQYQFADSGANVKLNSLLQYQFPSKTDASNYLNGLQAQLQNEGYITASIDSVHFDSTIAFLKIYAGQKYNWANIFTLPKDEDILTAVHWPKSSFKNSLFSMKSMGDWQEKILDYLENTGHPFASVHLDSIKIEGEQVEALLKIERGNEYKIDSLRIWGDVRIGNDFLQRYLELSNGSPYNKQKMLDVSKKIRELSFVEEVKPASVSLQGTGSVLNLYLKPKKSSQANVLLGFLPNSNTTTSKKFLITGEANILLRNSLGSGETIGLNWQQLQLKSPRLNLLFDQPFIFKSPIGLNFIFDILRKDSSYVNINMQLGANYFLSANRSATVFLQRKQNIVNGIDTIQIRQSKRLPPLADVSSTHLGVTLQYNSTNYRFNPRSGSEFLITGAAGKKKIRKNNQVLELKDPLFDFEKLYDTIKLNTYQARVVGYAAHYFPIAKQSVIKAGLHMGLLQSGNYFLNELFQIGGYKLLRGFSEESEYASQYVIGTFEYRYLIGMNSNFFTFLDGGWAKNPLIDRGGHIYLGSGLGMSFETKAGIFNLALALGKRDDTQLNLRQSKVHLGFVNYF